MDSFQRLREGRARPEDVRRAVALLVLVPVIAIALLTSYYTVAPEEEAVVLRFGRYIATRPPGLHFRLPFWIDDAIKVPVTEVRTEEFGFRTVSPGRRSLHRTNDTEALMLTGDLNIADIEWVVQYRVKDAREWIFAVREREGTIRDISESVMRAIVGDHTVTEALTEKRDEIAVLAKQALQSGLDSYGMGVHIVTVKLQNALPPASVRDSFNDVNAAEQERDRAQNEAQREYNKVIEEARGEAKREVAEAEGHAVDRVNRARGDVARFVQMRAVYAEAKEVTRKRLFLETIERILPQVQRVLVVDDEGVLKFLPLQQGDGR